jgi:LmbE family N-acetylglucosaminyl deacetylase
MLDLGLVWKEPKRLRVLCLGAHSDDIEIGCGGTILQLAGNCEHVEFWWVVFSATGKRRTEALKSANSFLKKKDKKVIIKSFRESFFFDECAKIKEFFEELKQAFRPNLIFTHYRNDLHQDHRTVSDLTWNTFRNHLILEYEVPKYDGDLGSPNFFVSLDEQTKSSKVGSIISNFRTQENRHWFTEDTFVSLMRLRGVESGGDSRYAEAFHCRKMVFSPSLTPELPSRR